MVAPDKPETTEFAVGAGECARSRAAGWLSVGAGKGRAGRAGIINDGVVAIVDRDGGAGVIQISIVGYQEAGGCDAVESGGVPEGAS